MNKQVSILTIVAILAVGLVVWLKQIPSKTTLESEFLFEDLQKFANQIDSVEIKNTQGVLFSAKKLGNKWLATLGPQQPVYPISQHKLAVFVETMMRAKLIEAKTNQSKNFVRLGLQSIDSEDSMAALVTFKADDRSWQVLVGNKVTLGEGHYVLKLGESQSWRTDKTIELPIDKFSWLKQPILPFTEQDIRSVSRIDSLNWQIMRTSEGNFELLDLPNGRKLQYDNILNSVVSNLTSLNFESLQVADDKFSQSLNVLTQLEVVTAEQQVFQVVVSELDSRHFVNFTSNQQPEYWQKWYYQVSNFSAQQLLKTVDDFLEEPSESKNTNETSPQSADEGESPF
ncbi:DUF4340 domain-containing protein [Paraglaciecola arctica]|uniref:DUF4340 domain-containing protein n=1 Tax=Paraglaciecola arctica TaxID=1128911 RepID=UPI001C07EA05|nr:DUF4340 domain-containing protein [Paraglaciecola arctica]MBU3003720.1 DUF4340 domain-containing protein [Paraglaciecola arctica]